MRDVSIVDEVEATVHAALSDEYRVEGFLGRGGMSIVFLARELALNRLVAMKVMPLKLATEKAAPERFQQEAAIAASLDHPHVTPIHRIGVAPDFLWYTMKYIRGMSLDETLRDVGRLDLHSCLSLIEQTATALDYAHKRGIVHRDMKPANVLLDENAWVYVCDFGVAKAAGNVVKLTQTGGTLGTPAYMSPEQLYGRLLDGRSDQYSLAVMTFELLTGRHPFVADSVGEIVRMHCVDPAPRLLDLRPDLPRRVSDGVQRAMSKDPEQRFADSIEYLTSIGGRRPPRAVQPRVSSAVTEAETAPLAMKTRPMFVRRAGHLTIGFAATAAVVAVAAVWGKGGEGGDGGGAGAAPAVQAEVPDSLPRTASLLEPGRLWLRASPWGYVFIDGDSLGTTPFIGIPIAAGVHRLRIEREGYATWEQDIDVPAGGAVRRTDIVLERDR